MFELPMLQGAPFDSGQPLFQQLVAEPLLGVSLGNVVVLRLDLCGGLAPGNKWFKLQRNIEGARREGCERILSFGGAWSNHLHALAAMGHTCGMETIGIVRGEALARPTAMLEDARRWGMQLLHVSRQEYRRRNDADYIAALQAQFSPCKVIPEGGANPAGVKGCMNIAHLIQSSGSSARRVVLSVGTGTTMAGVVSGLASTGAADCQVYGIVALKGALDLEHRIKEALLDSNRIEWQLLHDHHCGGFARVPPQLREFIMEFERVQQIPLDPIYTAKMFYAVHQLLAAGKWPSDEQILVIHSGGLQGRRGFDWLQ